MSYKRQRGDAWEYTFKRAGVLDKPLNLTFETEAEGDKFSEKLEALLDRGIVPTEYQTTTRLTTIATLIDIYLKESHVKDKDRQVLDTVFNSVGKTPLASINANWVDNWITDMKRVDVLAPSTIRAKVGSLARCTDWGMRKGFLLMPDHPLRSLRVGYAQYTELDTALAGEKREDVERDRRLEHGEFEKLQGTISVGVLPRTQRPYKLEHTVALGLLVTLAVETAMRLREMYTITTDQVDLSKFTVFLDRTKNGSKRQVPLSSVALAALRVYMVDREPGPLFPWWNGTLDKKHLVKTSDFLSNLFVEIAKTSGCVDLKFHDLRHEATSRIYERTQLSDLQISHITGHRSLAMLRRYANLRGSNLAQSMW